MIEVKAVVELDGDDIWVNGDLISKCDGDEEWTAFLDNNVQKEFETLEQAVTYCLEQAND